MKTKTGTLIATAVIMLVVALPVISQECSIQTITGTYVFRYTGQSFIGGPPYAIDVVANPAAGVLPLHAPGAYLSGSELGILTVNPDSSITARVWLHMGKFHTDPSITTLPAQVTSVEIEHGIDGQALGCIATLALPPDLVGGPATVDKFVVLDNGNEIRGVHATDGYPVTTSIAVGKRITRALDAAPRCGTNTMKGSYVATCPGLLYNSDGTTMSIASMLDLKSLPEGLLSGMLFNRVENHATESPVHGLLAMNPDCSGEGYLYGLLPGSGAKALFVLFAYDQGKGAFLLPTELELPNGMRLPYPSTQSCVVERTAP
ncbi:MAG: hypothetical protein ROO76_17065 [Terriglobia bacterium]|nr:hypothetical protein [Terriglobia bacterium]